MTKRENFLKELWTPYPEMPQGYQVRGRIQDLSHQEISIKEKNYPCAAQVALTPVRAAAVPVNFTEVLQKDDQVALKLEHGQVTEIYLLAPALEKPLQLSSSPELLQEWRHFVNRVREFFQQKSFLEVNTPTLVACPGTEPFLDLFSTELVVGGKKQKLYLPTSPELHLKKMLSSGYENIFEMRPCFRNGEITSHHQPEFWMLEWYRAYSDILSIKKDVQELVEFLAGKPLAFETKSMAQLFQEKLAFTLTPQTSLQELKSLGQSLGLAVENFELWDDVFYFIFVEKIEADLGAKGPLFVTDYPPSQAALARLTPAGWGDRFEFYWQKMEIANAFHELNDPQIQVLRFAEDLQKKQDLGKEVPPLDPEFMQALRAGMPPSGGIALGLERLFMALRGIKTLSQTRAFPI